MSKDHKDIAYALQWTQINQIHIKSLNKVLISKQRFAQFSRWTQHVHNSSPPCFCSSWLWSTVSWPSHQIGANVRWAVAWVVAQPASSIHSLAAIARPRMRCCSKYSALFRQKRNSSWTASIESRRHDINHHINIRNF